MNFTIVNTSLVSVGNTAMKLSMVWDFAIKCAALTSQTYYIILKMEANQPIYDNVDNVVSPDSSGIYYKSMSPDTLLVPGKDGEYEDACNYLRIRKPLRVLHLKSLRIVLCVLVLMLLSLIVGIVGLALASASWSNVLNQKHYVNPSVEQRIADLSNLLDSEVSALKKQDFNLGQRLIQVSQIHEKCQFEVANCSINLSIQDIKPSCNTNPMLPINKEVSTS